MSNHIQVDHNSDEWLEMRAGRLTSSSVPIVMANYGKSFGDPALRLAAKIAVEQLSKKHIPSNFSNKYMSDGHMYEPVAADLFSEVYFTRLENAGFYYNDDEGSSPDRVSFDRSFIVEIKTRTSFEFFKAKKSNKVPSSSIYQVLHQMKMSGVGKSMYVSFCPDMPREFALHVVEVDIRQYKAEVEMMNLRISEFLEKVAEIKKVLSS